MILIYIYIYTDIIALADRLDGLPLPRDDVTHYTRCILQRPSVQNGSAH